MRWRPLRIIAQMLPQPRIALRDGAGMHIVQLIWHDEGDGWKLAEVGWEAAKRLIARGGRSGEVYPGICLRA